MSIEKLHAKRKKAALIAAKKLLDAETALRDFVTACNDCNDESASLDVQGKGRDGRTALAREMSEYSHYLTACFDK